MTTWTECKNKEINRNGNISIDLDSSLYESIFYELIIILNFFILNILIQLEMLPQKIMT